MAQEGERGQRRKGIDRPADRGKEHRIMSLTNRDKQMGFIRNSHRFLVDVNRWLSLVVSYIDK